MTKSLYSILNVSPDADPVVIEAAYKALIKKHHPDVHEAPGSTRFRASEINEAYQTLKDPARRARYDVLSRQEAVRLSLAATGARRYYEPAPPSRRDARSRALSILTIALAVAVLLLVWRGADAGLGARSEVPAAQRHVKRARPLPPVDPQSVDQAVDTFIRIRDESGLLGLSAYSQACFIDQGRSSRASDFDHCVAFDHAAATYKNAAMKNYYSPYLPGFQPRETSLRHAAAGRRLSPDGSLIEQRLLELGTLTSNRLQEVLLRQKAEYEKALAAQQPKDPGKARETSGNAGQPAPPADLQDPSLAPDRSLAPTPQGDFLF